MVKTFTIPSVIEANGLDLAGVSSNLIDGLKLFHEDSLPYIIGDLAIREGVSPHKTINSSPTDKDYKLLAHAAMLIAAKTVEGSLCVTTGFPFFNYQIFRQKAYEFFQDNHHIRYDASPFSNTSLAEQNISVVKAMVIPELQGCNLAIRKSDRAEEGAFFLVSLGYGTFEAALSMPSGIVQRTAVSGSGVRYAVQSAIRELLRTYNIGLNAEHMFDQGFRTGKIVLNRDVLNIEDLRKKHLTIYFNEVISPLLAKTFSDKDYLSCSKLILVGGGALYEDLEALFKKEFDGVLEVQVQPEPSLCASKGYAIHSKINSEGINANPVGLDIGNATTVLSLYKDQKEGDNPFS